MAADDDLDYYEARIHSNMSALEIANEVIRVADPDKWPEICNRIHYAQGLGQANALTRQLLDRGEP